MTMSTNMAKNAAQHVTQHVTQHGARIATTGTGVKPGFLHGALMATALGLVGCAATSTPNVDAAFGQAVMAARAQQTINPDAARNPGAATGLDGRAAREAMERYHESFKAPPPSFNVINIGGGVSAGN